MESPHSSNNISDECSSMPMKISDAEDDKKFASQAVAFVIKHSHKGIVPLCASVATLLQEQDRLKKELKALREYIKHLQIDELSRSSLSLNSISASTENSHTLAPNEKNELKPTSVEVCDVTKDLHLEGCLEKHDAKNLAKKVLKQKREDEKNTQSSHKSMKAEPAEKLQKTFIAGCLCDQCHRKEILGLVPVKPPVREGQLVVTQGDIIGAVKYVGHLDCFEVNDVYVGIQLDEPVGDTNGSVKGKTYFNCSKKYGMIVLLTNIRCIIR